MSVNLQKGQKVDLTKGNASLKRVIIGLGWDEAKKTANQGGFLSRLFGGDQTQDIDCDASAILVGQGGKLVTRDVTNAAGKLNDDVVFFNNLKHKSGSVIHQGDNLTGAGHGDAEQILVNLLDVPSVYERVIFVVNIYKARERKQHFGMVENAFIRIMDGDTKQELFRYNLSENYEGKTGMVFGEVYRHQNEWKFGAIGDANADAGISDTTRRYV